MASNQQHWELIKMQSMDDTDTTEFSLLDLEPKPELDLMEIVTKVSEGADSARVELGRSAEGGPTDDGDGGTGNALGGAGSIPMSYGSSPNGGSLLSATSSTSMYDTQMLSDQKPQIRHDCMWAGMCADQSHPEKHSGGGCGGCARQHHLLQHQPQQQSSPGNPSPNLALTVVRHLHKTVQGGEQQSADVVTSTAKSGPPTSSSSVLANRAAASSNAFLPYSRAKYTSSQASLLAPFKASQGAARIPAGSSLLIKRQQQLSSGMVSQSCRQLPPSPPSSSSESGASSGEGASKASEQNLRLVRVPHTPRGSFLAALEQEARSIAAQNHARPDTPLSLDDDPLEFKHNLDLVATCTIGSNQQSLLHTASSLPSSASCSSSSSCSSSTSSSPVSSTTVSSASTAAIAAGVDSRSLYGRLGGYCSCSGNNTSSSISSIGHTAQCYYNYLQDTSSVDDIRNKQLREQLLMLDDPCAVLPNHHHHHHPHYHQPYSGQHLPHPLRTYSPDAELEQLLIDLREIDESSSCLLDDQQHTNSSVSHSASMKDGSPMSSLSASSVHHEQHHQQQQQDQQYQQQQRSALSLAPCGGELSGGAHATCNKECYCSSLELPHHLASPSSERRRRHQFAHRRRSITGRGWMSDDDEDEEEDLLKQLEEEDDFYDKHFEQNGANVVAAGNTATCGYTNSSSWEDDEEEDEDEEEEEEDEEESGEEEENKDEQEEEIDEDEEEEEGDANEESMYGDGSSSRSRSRVRSFRHRYHNQYNHQRRVARSYRPYGSSGKSQKKQSTNNVLATGGVNTIIAGSGASLKSSMLGSKIGSTSCNSSSTTNGSLNNSVVTSAAQQQSTGGTGANSYQATHFGDHSYTRPKGGYNMNELGVQTPSDSDEEIDVVSVGDKNLPTNPTERDMRHMQSEVANKIRTASSRSAGNGSLPYGTGSSHHHHHYQRQHHLADGQRVHHLGGIYPTPAGSTTISGANTPLPTRSGGASVASSPPPACTTSTTGLLHTSSSTSSSSGTSRKRPVGGSSKRSSNASKRMRLAHSKRGGGGGAGGDGSNGVRCDTAAQALAEELDTVEKRNLHNNLERQRRIGLKNLFEELKRQIPQLRDKDRAPKVNILREAAALCTRLNQEAEQVNELRQQQMKLHERVRYLRASIYSQQRFDI